MKQGVVTVDCIVSGHVPDTPVVSAKSGLLFEKRLILHEIEEHGVCPITKEPLTTEDLMDIKIDKVDKHSDLSRGNDASS